MSTLKATNFQHPSAVDPAIVLDSSGGASGKGVVSVYANAAARTAAITSPTEGMITTLNDTDTVQRYDGSAWVNINESPWTTYTPTWGGAVTIGNGSSSGEYKIIEDLVFFRVLLSFGSTSSMGNGLVNFTLPTTQGSSLQMANATVGDFGLTTYFNVGCGELPGAIDIKQVYLINNSTGASTGGFSSTSPMTWTTNDKISVNGCYRKG